MVDRARLMEMNKDQLVNAVERAVDKAKALKDKLAQPASEAMDWMFAGAGGAVVGWWLGGIQRKIDAGEEGYDEESLKFYWVDKDLLGSIGVGVLSQIKQFKKFKGPLKDASMGSFGFWAGRKMFMVAAEPEEEE